MNEIKIYFAPLEGITSYIFRNAFSGIYGHVDKFFTPFISPAVRIDGVPHLDGGCACKIPYQWALGQGFDKIIVVKTQDIAYRKPAEVNHTAFRVYRNHRAFAQKLAYSAFDYNRQCDDIERLHAEGRLMRIAPSAPVTVSRLESDMEKLGDLYWLGCADCLDAIDQMRDYLLA